MEPVKCRRQEFFHCYFEKSFRESLKSMIPNKHGQQTNVRKKGPRENLYIHTYVYSITSVIYVKKEKKDGRLYRSIIPTKNK